MELASILDQQTARGDFSSRRHIYGLPAPVEVGSNSLLGLIQNFDFRAEDWLEGETALAYSQALEYLPFTSREAIYDEVLASVKAHRIEAKALFCFIIFEPHRRLVAQAVQDYLVYRQCDLVDEFAGVEEVISAVVDGNTANRGAVLAGLVLMGDRRINALARSARRSLSLADIRDFSRVQLTAIQGNTVEFYVDWLIELTREFRRSAVEDLTCGLMLMALHDEKGMVTRETEVDHLVGFDSPRARLDIFERYYAEIAPILTYLQQFEGFDTPIASTIDCWESHKNEAQRLRTMSTA